MQRFPHFTLSSPFLRATSRRAALAAALLATSLVPVVAAAQATPAPGPADPASAAAWLRDQQLPEGGYAGFSGEADPSFTALAIVALAAARDEDPATAAAIESASGWLAGTVKEYAAQGPGSAAIATAAAVAAGEDPSAFGGVDLVAAMRAPLPETDAAAVPGLMGNDVNDHATIVIGLAAAGETVDPAMLDALAALQSADGGWSWDGQTGTGVMDSNTTALVIQAYAAAGRAADPAVAGAVEALRAFLVPGAGFAYQLADPLTPDANSTALVLQALIAAGEDPASEEWGNAPAALASFVQPDGSFLFMQGDGEPSLYAALQAIPALAGTPYPVARLCADGEDPVAGCVVPAAS